MKQFFILLAVFALIGVAVWTIQKNQITADAQQTAKNQTAAPPKSGQKMPVLVELSARRCELIAHRERTARRRSRRDYARAAR